MRRGAIIAPVNEPATSEITRILTDAEPRERADHTLSPTALVHEAWLRLVGASVLSFENRAHFFAAAAEAMRRILIEHARAKARVKRDGGVRVDLAAIESQAAAGFDDDVMLALDSALSDLETHDPAMSQVAVLRYFGGLSVEEVAAALGTSPRSVNRLWTQARAWLLVRLES